MYQSRKRLWIVVALALVGMGVVGFVLSVSPAVPVRAIDSGSYSLGSEAWSIRFTNALTNYVYLPFICETGLCAPIPGESYATLRVIEKEDTPRPAETHPDKNLAIRGYEPAPGGDTGLVTNSWGGWDSPRPDISNMCVSGCQPPFSSLYQVHHWDWGLYQRGPVIDDPPVTLVGMNIQPGEPIYVPTWGGDTGSGYDAMVMYATTERITLIYSMFGPCDSVVCGYTIHVEGVCVEPNLLALYNQLNTQGRDYLPALHGGQAIGRARGSEILVAVRNSPGSFHDPRHVNFWP